MVLYFSFKPIKLGLFLQYFLSFNCGLICRLFLIWLTADLNPVWCRIEILKDPLPDSGIDKMIYQEQTGKRKRIKDKIKDKIKDEIKDEIKEEDQKEKVKTKTSAFSSTISSVFFF